MSAKVTPHIQAGLLTSPPFQQPSHPDVSKQWHAMAKRVPFSKRKGRGYSGGPIPDFHGVPY